MSQPSESESLTERLEGFEAPLERLREVYHVPVLAALFAFMLWVRARHWDRFVVDGRVLFSGNDAWYHYRMVEYTVRHYPGTMPFDPWTQFPLGTSVGQFGTLYDQLMATAALVYGLGSPTEQQTAMVVLFTPAVVGALVVIPVYVVGAKLSESRLGGLVAALVLALTPGQFLTRSLVGFSDHHVAEALFMAVAVVALLAALRTAMRDKPVWELVRDREVEALRPTLVRSALAGLAVGLYIWVWPPAVFFVGILGIFFGLTMLGQQVRGVSPDHLAVPGAVIGLVAFVMTLIPFQTTELSPVNFTLVQPGLSLALTLGVVGIAAGARLWDSRDLPRWSYPVVVLGLGLVVAGLAAVVVPDLFGFFQRQVLRIVGFGTTSTGRTVGEVQPPDNPTRFLYNSYGLAFYTAVGGVGLLAYRVFGDREVNPRYSFVIVWSVFLLLATLTQSRFDYYLVLAVAVLNGVLFTWVFDLVDFDEIAADLRNVSAYQVLTLLAVVMVLTVPMTYRTGGTGNAVQTSDAQAAPGPVQNWDESLLWLDENTPEVGAYGTGGEGDLEYYGTYQRTDDFDYSEGSYGVIAWWDYGHWITAMGQRPAFANPFQQQARPAADFLLAPNESAASDQLVSEDGEETRYVMIDYQLGLSGTTKFTAPTAWETEYDIGAGDVTRPIFVASGNQLRFATSIQTERSMRSMRTRLYQHHGSAVGPESPNSALGRRVVVVDWGSQQLSNGQTYPVVPSDGPLFRAFPNVTAAEEFVQNDDRIAGQPTSQIGGVLGEPPVELEAVEQYRLVHVAPVPAETPASQIFRFTTASQSGTSPNSIQRLEVQPWVKTFEKVPGATVEGQGPADTTVTARVRMSVPNGQNFTYVQRARTDEDGRFTMTLPYSTTGYADFGPETGYTNVSVRAQGPYQFTTGVFENESAFLVGYGGTANVTEGQVVGTTDEPVTVDLEKTVFEEPEGANRNTSDTNSTDTSGDTSGDSGGNTSDTNSTDTNSTESLAGPRVVAPARS